MPFLLTNQSVTLKPLPAADLLFYALAHFESGASANSTTPANNGYVKNQKDAKFIIVS